METRMKDDTRKREIALFRMAVLGDLIHARLRRGAQRRALETKANEVWLYPDGKSRRIPAKTIEAWLYAYRKGGIDGLLPRERKDKGACKAIPQHLQDLILDMKREDPGRSVPLILSELRGAGLMRPGLFSASAVGRLLNSHGLSGPKLFDHVSGRELRVKIFGLLDDKSRLVTYLRAGFHERQEDFLRVLLDAIVRRGIPRAVLLDSKHSVNPSPWSAAEVLVSDGCRA